MISVQGELELVAFCFGVDFTGDFFAKDEVEVVEVGEAAFFAFTDF